MGIDQSFILGLKWIGTIVRRQRKEEFEELGTCHSSASLVTLPVEVVDSGPEPGGRELVAGAMELQMVSSSFEFKLLLLPAFHSKQL